jgi:hypothetical protein
VRQSVINNQGTGILDFDQLNFGGVQEFSDGSTDLLLAQTRIQGHFDRLAPYGLERAEIIQLDVTPIAFARAEGNAGDGYISNSSIVLSGAQRRREFKAILASAGTYDVYEYIIGHVSRLSDGVLIDETKNFENESDSFSGYKLIPLRDASSEVSIESASGQEIVVASGSPILYSLTSVGSEYALYNSTPTHLAVGDEFVNSDGSVRFTLEAGSTPFLKGDSFLLNVFPSIGDIELKPNEYPELSNADFVTRTSGGSRT